MVLLSRWTCTAAEDGILMPQPLKLMGGGGGALLVHHQMHALQEMDGGAAMGKD
jgi:hypothetical protein